MDTPFVATITVSCNYRKLRTNIIGFSGVNLCIIPRLLVPGAFNSILYKAYTAFSYFNTSKNDTVLYAVTYSWDDLRTATSV